MVPNGLKMLRVFKMVLNGLNKYCGMFSNPVYLVILASKQLKLHEEHSSYIDTKIWTCNLLWKLRETFCLFVFIPALTKYKLLACWKLHKLDPILAVFVTKQIIAITLQFLDHLHVTCSYCGDSVKSPTISCLGKSSWHNKVI